ncbi:tetratricopeptide repeat protein [Trinickia dinghuensis]|uniref:Tetratricopeptide repeat protein n=2 Tax=Trinickia dinghuensis TaxID=2291023 RepID=A0A3D8K3W2_9BURK|nr:tetratricopeptide repeat protein [Trinickia dinghuensis]
MVGLLAAGSMTGCASGPRIETRPVVATHGVDKSTDLRIAESALESGDTQLAASLFEKALKADPSSSRAELGLADAIYQAGDLARAGMLYAHVAAGAPDDPRAQLGLARVALRERNLDDAVARYRRLLAAHPDNPVAAEGLGAALDLQGKHGEAQAVYRAALARHPEAQGLKTNLGLSLILDRRARAGANVLLDIAGLPDAPAQARENLALAYGVLGNAEAAKRILTADMPAASAEDNLRFYQNLRARWSTPSSQGDAAGNAGSGHAASVQPVPSAQVSPQGALE